MASMTTLSEYVLEILHEGADFTLYRGPTLGDQSPVLAMAVSAEQPSPQSLRRIEHEYSLAVKLDAIWGAKPLALTRHEGRKVLILHDPRGEPLNRVLERKKATARFDSLPAYRHWLGNSTRSSASATPFMNTNNIVLAIDAEISRLQQARAFLTYTTGSS
jgi:hypothetical protein